MKEHQKPDAVPEANGEDISFLQTCLYFTVNRLSRVIARMADDAFATTGLAPAYGYLIRLAIHTPGISQKELAEQLSITPSTLTRFVDKLEGKGLVKRQLNGKTVLVYPTDKGIELGPILRQASKRLKSDYEALLGPEAATALTEGLTAASDRLEK